MGWLEWLIFIAIVLMTLGVLEAGITFSRSGIMIGKPRSKRQASNVKN